MTTLQIKYFEWMYNLVCTDRYNHLSYKKLFNFLHNIPFTYILELDENRAVDGVDLRYQFGLNNNIDIETIREQVDILPCSVLEMMVSLAFNLEQHIMDDTTYGDRTGQWFWSMIISLGLGFMHDMYFDEECVSEIVYTFLSRQYQYNGDGGLFTIIDAPKDLRTVEIWTQAMWYLNDVINDSAK